MYSTNDDIYRDVRGSAKISEVDFIAAALSAASLVPLLVGLSFAGSRYEWTDWRTLVPVCFGSACLLVCAMWELRLGQSWLPLRSYRDTAEPLLGLESFKDPQAVNTLIGAVVLGALVSPYAVLKSTH